MASFFLCLIQTAIAYQKKKKMITNFKNGSVRKGN